MQERDVITLSEGLDYLLVSEIEHESEKYFLAMGIDQDNIYIEDHCFFKVGIDEKGEEFLEGPTAKTKKILKIYEDVCKEEVKKHVIDIDTETPAGINVFKPGYISKEDDVIVGLQTDSLCKRSIVYIKWK